MTSVYAVECGEFNGHGSVLGLHWTLKGALARVREYQQKQGGGEAAWVIARADTREVSFRWDEREGDRFIAITLVEVNL